MRLEIVMGLMSSFQIYHQCMSNVLSSLNFGYSSLQMSLVTASFPVGKLFGTVSVIFIFRKNYSNRQCLDCAAGLLICGSMIMLIPFLLFLCLSRFIIGLGVGISFVSAFVALNNYADNTVNSSNRSQAFLCTAALFSAATFLANASAYFHSISYLMLVITFLVPSLMAGLNYFWHRLDCCERPDYSSLRSIKREYEDFENKEHLEIACAEQQTQESVKLIMKCSPKRLAIVLMSINATIGVPVVLAFCSIIYRRMGLSQEASIHLSTFYPLLQLVVILILRHWSTRNGYFSNRQQLLGGYAFCLLAMFLMLVTLQFDTLNQQPTSKAVASAFWYTIVVVASGIPCNAGVRLINEIFYSKKELVEGLSISRAFFWIFSSILSGTFLLVTEHHSLFLAFAPCFSVSLLAYIVLVFIIPESVDKNVK